MKRISAVLLLSVAVSAPAFAADEGFYAGVTLGQGKASNISGLAYTKSSNSVYGGLIGYQYNKNLAVEVAYTGAGKFTATAPGVIYNGKADALAVTAVGTMPVSDSFDLYGKLGLASVKSTLSMSPLTTASGATRSSLTVGLGAQYNVTPTVGIRLGWDRYGAAVKDVVGTKVNYNYDVYSVGAVFKF